MNFIIKNKTIVCVCLIIAFLFTFLRVIVTASDDEFLDMDEDLNIIEDDSQYEDINVIKPSLNSSKKSNENTNIDTDKNTSKNTVSNSNTLAKTGIEDAPSILIIGTCVVSIIYAYKKIKQYKNM